MATLSFPTYIVSNSINSSGTGQFGNMMGIGSNTNSTIISGSNTAATSLLIIYKGSMPSSFASFTDRSSRSSDVLITFTSAASAVNFSDLGVISNAQRYLIGKYLTNQAASASGTATWFLACRNGTTTLTDKGALMGTVGTTGSGADLEIPNISIVNAANYQSAGFYINFPQTWTVA